VLEIHKKANFFIFASVGPNKKVSTFPGAPRLHARKKEEERLAEKRTPLPKPPAMKSDKEKDDLRKKMREKYEVKYDIPERILYMALESVLYDEDQANNLM